MPRFWCEYLEKREVHISTQGVLYSGPVHDTKCEHSLSYVNLRAPVCIRLPKIKQLFAIYIKRAENNYCKNDVQTGFVITRTPFS